MKLHQLLNKQVETYLSEEHLKQLPDSFLEAVSRQYEQTDTQRVSSEEIYAQLNGILNSISEAILIVDLKGKVQLLNPNFRSLFRLNNDPMPIASMDELDKHLSDLNEDQHISQAVLKALTKPEQIREYEFILNQSRSLETFCSPHWLGEKIIGQIWCFRDVTDSKLKEEEAKHRAYHDLLTGLPNRRLLTMRLNQAISQAELNTSTVVLFIDLDGFKDVNDSLGHNIGDSMLREVAKRLESCLPPESLLARHGGDEFVAIIENQQDTTNAIRYTKAMLNAFVSPFKLGDENLYMSASIGIAYAPDHGEEADKIISHADIAMSKAKQQGKNTYQVFNTESEGPTSHRLKIRNQLNDALDDNAFELFFQPKISLETGAIKGAEALIRWKEVNGGYRSPLEFIPVAEETGQIIPISQWVIRRCCLHLQEWKNDLDDDFVLALNISAKHFKKGQLQKDLSSALKEFDIDPSKLELEVTETAIMDDIDLAVETLDQLKGLGIRTAIDDFGTGYSSLNYLRKLPIEILKIDKSFIDEILTSKEDRTLVKGIIDMVHALGIEVVAEGVENHHMAQLLNDMKCDQVQGYHYHKPMPEREFLSLLKESLCYI